MANSIARRQPAITFILSCRIKRKATSKVRKNESHAYDWFHGIDELVSSVRQGEHHQRRRLVQIRLATYERFAWQIPSHTTAAIHRPYSSPGRGVWEG